MGETARRILLHSAKTERKQLSSDTASLSATG